MNLEFSLQAKLELFDAQDRYEAEREGLGQQFIDEMDALGDRVAAAPHQFPIVPGTSARRALGRRFPYALIFFVRSDHVRVIAVAHERRDPSYWSGRS